MGRKEIQEAREVKRRMGKNARVAAFFDLDGTLLPKPSLEKRFFAMLRHRRWTGARNYFWWLREAVRLVPRGTSHIAHANKMYLRGVRVEEALGEADKFLPRFCRKAIERVALHAKRGDSIVLVSGTLEPLAMLAAHSLEAELGARGRACTVRVCATRLGEERERWSGRIVGEAMFGEAKASAIRRIAAETDLDLLKCFAYGDSARDRWMLEAVGKPAAVNPSNDLARMAQRNGWPVLCWQAEESLRERGPGTERSPWPEKNTQRMRRDRQRARYEPWTE